MRHVEDRSGRTLYLLKRSASSSLVFDPSTGERSYRPNDELVALDRAIDDRHVILELLSSEGPTAVRTLLDTVSLCESDLFGLLLEMEAGGLIEERIVFDERAYAITGDGLRLLDQS